MLITMSLTKKEGYHTRQAKSNQVVETKEGNKSKSFSFYFFSHLLYSNSK